MLSRCALRKRAPRRRASFRGGWQLGCEQHITYRGGGDLDAGSFEFADDAPVAPARILTGEAEDDCPQRRFERRPALPRMRIRPAASACRRKAASSWRRTRISSSFERRGRPSSHTSANRLRTTRYANDQSKQPSLEPRLRAAELKRLSAESRTS